MMFEKAPIPPVGKAFVKEIRVIAHMVGSKRPSTVEREVRTVSPVGAYVQRTRLVFLWQYLD